MENEDMKLELSSHALGALHEFYAERDAQEKRYEDLRSAAEPETKLSTEMFQEDWNISQFWYTDKTAEVVARALLSNPGPDSSIAVLCVPSVFIQLKNLIATGDYGSPRVSLFEFDERFSVLEGYVKYDFNTPFALPPNLEGQFDRFVCDPPFLNDDCHTKAALTVRWLSKGGKTSSSSTGAQIVVCTGERMERTIYKLYPGTGRTSLEIKHGRNGLCNEYACFANFECDQWRWISEAAN